MIQLIDDYFLTGNNKRGLKAAQPRRQADDASASRRMPAAAAAAGTRYAQFFSCSRVRCLIAVYAVC